MFANGKTKSHHFHSKHNKIDHYSPKNRAKRSNPPPTANRDKRKRFEIIGSSKSSLKKTKQMNLPLISPSSLLLCSCLSLSIVAEIMRFWLAEICYAGFARALVVNVTQFKICESCGHLVVFLFCRNALIQAVCSTWRHIHINDPYYLGPQKKYLWSSVLYF